MINSEQWKQIPGFKGYSVSDQGRVRTDWVRPCNNTKNRRSAGDMISQSTNKDGYRQAKLSRGGCQVGCRVHRLVLFAFVGTPPEGHECDHINRVRDDNRLENLRWVTPKGNSANRDKSNVARGERNGGSKLTEVEARRVFLLREEGMTLVGIGRELGVSHVMVSYILRGKNWTHLDVQKVGGE